jgi:hypothetical protein
LLWQEAGGRRPETRCPIPDARFQMPDSRRRDSGPRAADTGDRTPRSRRPEEAQSCQLPATSYQTEPEARGSTELPASSYQPELDSRGPETGGPRPDRKPEAGGRRLAASMPDSRCPIPDVATLDLEQPDTGRRPEEAQSCQLPATSFQPAGGWRLEAGGWRLETGDWRLETGDWRLETGDWRLETGDWRLLQPSTGWATRYER